MMTKLRFEMELGDSTIEMFMLAEAQLKHVARKIRPALTRYRARGCGTASTRERS
jgi:hypothetical protein